MYCGLRKDISARCRMEPRQSDAGRSCNNPFGVGNPVCDRRAVVVARPPRGLAMKQSRNLLAVIAGQSSVVAILVLVLVLSIAGAPLLQQKQVVAQNLGSEVAIAKAHALTEAVLANAAGKHSLDTFNPAFSARHFPGALDQNAAAPTDAAAA